MKTILPLAAVLGLTACESVEIQYTAPSKADDFASAEVQANEHYEYVAFPKAFILVRPVEQDTAKNTDDPASAKKTDGGASDKAKPEQRKGNDAGAVPEKPAAKKTPKAAAAVKGSAAASAAGASAPAGAKDKAGDAAAKKDEAPSTPPPTLSDSLASAVIDGKKWEAKVVLMPDDKRTFAVKGVTGFWKSTTIGLTKYQNSDMVSSVSSTAENLVPKRIGQAASFVAAAIQIVGALPVEGARKEAMPLQSFIVEVPGRGPKSDTINDDWTYSFAYDTEEPPVGTVSYKDFSEKAMNRKVAYWPTPACRSATLTIGRESDKTQAAFHITVSSSDVIRLQPLPAKGKVDFGSICGATASGTAAVDPVASASDDLQALQQAIKTIKDAKQPSSSASAAKGGGAASAPKK